MTQPYQVDWNALKSEWHERSTEKIREALWRLKLISDLSLDAIHKALKVEEVWLKAFQTTDGSTLLAYFVFVWGMQMWEFTSEHADVRRKVADARIGYVSAYRTAQAIVKANGRDKTTQLNDVANYLSKEQNLAYLIFSHFTIPVDLEGPLDAALMPVEAEGTLLLDAMGVESAVYGGSTAAARKRAEAIAGLCNKVLENEEIRSDRFCGLFSEVLGSHRDYYGCIAKVAEALQLAEAADLDRSAQLTREAISSLKKARDNLEKTQETLGDDVYASELPAYRMALKAWHERLGSPPPSVRLDSMNITYIYPFTFPGIEGNRVQDIVLDYGRSTEIPPLAGLQPEKPDKLELTDMWTHGGRGAEINSTIVMKMPTLDVKLRDDDHAACSYNVEFRFNEPGNHYLRVDLALNQKPGTHGHKITLNNINQALRRSTVYSGEHEIVPNRVGTSNEAPWYFITEYAKAVINDITDSIIKSEKSGRPHSRETPWTRLWRRRDNTETFAAEAEATEKCWFNPDFDYRIVVAIHAASVLHGKPASELTQAAIENAYGAVLLQLLGRETTALDEWICWGGSQQRPNLLGDARFPSDFAMGTGSTTVLYMPSTPRWAQSGYQEVAEFAASLPSLIRQSRRSLEEKLDNADNFMQKDDDNRIDVQETELDWRRTDLHTALKHLRKLRTYLVPSQLLSLRAEGSFLESLYRESRLPELKEDIDSYLERGRAAIDRMNMREARLHDHRNRKYQDVVQILLFAVGTFSIAGVATLGLTLYYGAELPGKNTKVELGGEFHSKETFVVGALYLAAVIIGGVIYYWARKTQLGTRRRRPRD
jgi:hypothetical protein